MCVSDDLEKITAPKKERTLQRAAEICSAEFPY